MKIKQSIFDKIVQIDEALKNIRVADPAVGSGAFPLGMINEIVRARNNITEYLVRLNKSNKLDRKYEENYIRRLRSQYKMKWDTIKNSIFAVDIEPSAVDIAKLRLWLSIVVEQEIDDENPEPHPLPNLDSNIMVGNSLIDEYEGIKLFDESILHKYKSQSSREESETHSKTEIAVQMSFLIDHSDDMLKEMFELQDRLFEEDDEQKKKQIKVKIDKIRDDLIEYKLTHDGNVEGLTKYNEMKKSKSKPFFIWELEFAKVFKEKGGFDVVIGNPPYVGEKNNKEIFRPIASTEFGKKYYIGKMDLFYFFFHKGLDIGNPYSELAFITTNYYPTAFGGRKLREDFKQRAQIRKLINFNEMRIFESALGQHNMITILTKKKEPPIDSQNCFCHCKGIADAKMIKNIVYFNSAANNENKTDVFLVPQEAIYDSNESYIRLSGCGRKTTDSTSSILEKISMSEYILEQVAYIKQGIVSGADKVTEAHLNKYPLNASKGEGIFVLTDDEVLSLGLNNCELEFVKSTYKNSNIYKYSIDYQNNLKVLYITKEVNPNNIPNIIAHLKKFKCILEAKRETSEGNLPWYCLHWARDNEIFNANEKIVNSRRAKSNIFALETERRYEQSDIMISVIKPEFLDLFLTKYILAILNSKLYYVWLKSKGKLKGDLLELYGQPLSELPIRKVDIIVQKQIVTIIDEIFIAKKDNPTADTTNLEKCIDQAVYKLYGLTEEEIKIVEGI
jgi:adenine-specific DNA-methyltransferase